MSQPMALVTGGAGGMGLATVERLARDGFSVVMVDRDAALANQETQRLQALGLDVQCRVLDLTDETAVRDLIRTLPPISALVNNAGIFDERQFLEVTTADFRRAYLVVDRRGVRILRDPYSSKPYVLFYTTKRVGGGLQDFDAIKLLKFGAA